jgi:hypothetical protein
MVSFSVASSDDWISGIERRISAEKNLAGVEHFICCFAQVSILLNQFGRSLWIQL